MRTILNYLKSAVIGVGLLASVATAKAETLSGKVYDALTSQTMNSFPVQLDDEKKSTDLNGNYNFDIPVGNHHLKISDNVTGYFNYEEDVNLTTTLQRNVYMIPVRQVDTQYYSDFLKKMEYFFGADGSYPDTRLWRWRDDTLPLKVWYDEQEAIQIYTQFYGDEGTSLAQKCFSICDIAIAEWNEKSRLNLMQRVDQNPQVGIEVHFKGSPRVDSILYFADDTPRKYKINVDYANPTGIEDYLKKLYEHELGHCLRFMKHSSDPTDNMNGYITSNISQNEADIAHIIYTLPLWTQMAYYNSRKTQNGVQGWNLYQ